MRVEAFARAVAEPQIGIGLGDVGMRIERPRLLQNLARLALLARFRQPPPGQRRRRHQIGRELDRFQHRGARAVAVDLLQRQRAGGQQHRALAAVVGFLERALHGIERVERAGPVGGGAAIVEHRLSGPGERRRGLGRFLGGEPRGLRIVAPLRLDIEPAQAEQLGVVAPGHVAEGALGAGAVAGHLRRLRGEQQRQRIAGRQPRRVVGRAARAAQIAGADRDQSARDREIAFHRAAMAEEQRHLLGRAQDAAHDRPQQHEHEHQRGEAQARPPSPRFRCGSPSR